LKNLILSRERKKERKRKMSSYGRKQVPFYAKKKKKELGVANNEIDKKKKKTKKKKTTKRKKKEVNTARSIVNGKVCSCDPGSVPLSFGVIDGKTSTWLHLLELYISESNEENEDPTFEKLKIKYGEMVWNEIAKRMFGFLDSKKEELKGVMELVLEHQLSVEASRLAGLVQSYFALRYPECKVVTIYRTPLSNFFKINKRFHGKTDVHSENKRQAVMFVIKNKENIRCKNDVLRYQMVHTNHFSDCIINYCYLYLRDIENFVKGPFDTKDWVKEKKEFKKEFETKSRTSCVKIVKFDEINDDEVVVID
jgi:hypothetical protein